MPRLTLQSGATKRRTVKDNKAKLKNVLLRNKRMSDFLSIIKEPPQNPSSSKVVNEVLSCQSSCDISEFSSLQESEPGTSSTVYVESHDNDGNCGSGNNHEDRDTVRCHSANLHLSTDPALWFPITSDTTNYWINELTNTGLDDCRNKSESDSYRTSKRFCKPTKLKPNGHFRFFSNNMFYMQMKNGEQHFYKWIVYSPSKGSIYCLFCTLMNSHCSQFSQPSG